MQKHFYTCTGICPYKIVKLLYIPYSLLNWCWLMSLILRTVPNSRDIASCEECLGIVQLTNIFLLWLVANNITIMHLCNGKGHIFVWLGNNLVLYATLYYNMCSTHLNIDFSTLELQQCGYDLCRHISSERKRINSLIGYISLGIELWIRLNKCFFGVF